MFALTQSFVVDAFIDVPDKSSRRGYFPPEFSRGQRGFASDIYSLGVIIGEILTGEKWYPEDENVEQVKHLFHAKG
jgi:serine/threonine protein kinase